MSKKSIVIKIVLWSLLAAFLTNILVSFILGDFGIMNISFFEPNKEKTLIYEHVFLDVEPIDGLSVKWKSGKVNVTRSEDEQIRLAEWSAYNLKESEKMNCTVLDGTLVVTQKSRWGFIYWGFGHKPSSLELQLPEKLFKKVELSMTSGKANINDVDCGEFSVKLTSGNVKLNGIVSNSVYINLTSGKIDGTAVITEKFMSRITSGNLNIDGDIKNIDSKVTSGNTTVSTITAPDSMDIKVTSGKIRANIPDNDGFVLYLKKTSGDFKSDFDMYSPVNGGKNEMLYKEGGNLLKAYNINITSGRVELYKKEN